jgi:hypothetical protein
MIGIMNECQGVMGCGVIARNFPGTSVLNRLVIPCESDYPAGNSITRDKPVYRAEVAFGRGIRPTRRTPSHTSTPA